MAGGGDGPIRSNFADTAYFKLVPTNGNGEANVSFKLPDNVTKYRVTAHSANKDLYLGVNTKKITSKLDFFVQSTEPRGLKKTDDVVLNATSIADTKYDVDYSFTIKEIDKTLTATGSSNSVVTVNFGKLPLGKYHAIIKGNSQFGEDAIQYEFEVVETAQEVKKKTATSINNQTKIEPTKNPVVLEIYNKKMSKYLEYIDFIESTQTERLDTQIAYNKVQELKERYYGNKAHTNQIQMNLYTGDNYYLKNLRNGEEDIVLTALVKYYAKYYGNYYDEASLSENDNLFEYYLLKAAEGKPVLNDLIYLKEEKDISNYDKLLLTLSLEFVGDFRNASDLYTPIELTPEEAEEYKSLVAIIDTFIRKYKAEYEIDELIQNNPADEYVRFACLSYFQNNSNEIEKTDTVRITSKNVDEIFSINSMQVKTLTIYDEDIGTINFETESEDLMVSYYYQTLLENIDGANISEDIKISGKGKFTKGNTIQMTISFEGDYEGELRIALPNSLRLAKNYNIFDNEAKYYIQSNHIDYVTIYKMKECHTIDLPLLIINEGNYKFESIVCKTDDIYHISNELEFDVN